MSQTLVPVHASVVGWSEGDIGIIGSAYFFGFVIGCLTVPKLLTRVGHIRVFLTLSGITSASILMLRDMQDVSIWIGLRLLAGWCLAAIYTTAESWINENAENAQRGRLISIYVLVSLGGMASGQILFGLIELEYLFSAAAMLILASLVPVGLFCRDQPMLLEKKNIRMRSVRKVPLRARGCMFFSGLVTGSIWTMTPLIIESSQLDIALSGLIMMTVIIGGAAFQLPVGTASDRFERLTVTKILVFSCLTISVVGFFARFDHILHLAVIMFLLGGTSLSLYTLASAEANDLTELTPVEIASVLLFMNGLGSAFGPPLTGLVMSWTYSGLFLVSGGGMVSLLVLLYVDRLSLFKPEITKGEESDSADVINIENYLGEEEILLREGPEQKELTG